MAVVTAQRIAKAIECANSLIDKEEKSKVMTLSFYEWALELERDGILVDGAPFTFRGREALRQIYQLVSDIAEDPYDTTLTVMKGAQTGVTVLLFLLCAYLTIRNPGIKIGTYYPDRTFALDISANRFLPIVRGIKSVYLRLLEANAGQEGNVLTRQIGKSFVRFLWTSGGIATESTPLDVVQFDEVQNMTPPDIEKTKERASNSKFRLFLLCSTAKNPGEDIDFFFRRGCQFRFHTECGCADGIVLDQAFPACVEVHPETLEYQYRCPECRTWIDDPQRGRFVKGNPEAGPKEISIHFPQTLSATVSPTEMVRAFLTADDKSNFYQRKLGRPYLNPDQSPITMEVLNRCVDEGTRLGVTWESGGRGYVMGVDQMGGFNCTLIAKQLPNQKMAIVHAEVVTAMDPWARLDELMAAYKIRICVVEQLPNIDPARQFAARHRGKVFLITGYADMEEMVIWGDLQVAQGTRRTATDYKDRYTVRADQYRVMSWAFARLQDQYIVFPDPQGLVQEVYEAGIKKAIPLLKDMVFKHLQKTALIVEKDEKEHKFRRKVHKVEIDPHFSYALMAVCIGWFRYHGSAGFSDDLNDKPEAPDENVDHRPEVIKDMEAVAHNVCGDCLYRDVITGICSGGHPGVRMEENDPACQMFVV